MSALMFVSEGRGGEGGDEPGHRQEAGRKRFQVSATEHASALIGYAVSRHILHFNHFSNGKQNAFN